MIAVATLAAYANGLGGKFVYDDLGSIRDNPTIRRLWPPWHALAPPSGSGLPVAGRPLVNLSLAVNRALSGLNPEGYHLWNIAVHAAAAVVLFGLVRRTLRLPIWKGRYGGGARPKDADLIALAAALFWALHPLNTAAVTYISQRAESMAGLLYLATLYGFVRYAAAVRSAARKRWAAVAVATCCAGMATKEVMVSAPLALLLFDRTFVAGSFRDALRTRRRFHSCAALSWVLLAVLVVRTGTRGGTAAAASAPIWLRYGAVQVTAVMHYLRLSVWPQPLVFDYGADLTVSSGRLAVEALALVAGIGATTGAVVRRSPAGLAGAFILLVLAPTSIVPILSEPVAEHRMYLPAAVIAVVLAASVWRVAGRAAVAPLICAAVAFGLLTASRNRVYGSDEALWRDTVAKVAGNARARFNLGAAEAGSGHISEAIRQYRLAVELRPDFPSAHGNLADALRIVRRPREAAIEAATAVRLDPRSPEAHNNLGAAFSALGRPEDAAREYATAVRLAPGDPRLQRNLGATLALLGRWDAALRHLELALQFGPPDERGEVALANLFARQGHFREAARHYERALSLDPGDSAARKMLARIRLLQGKP